MGVGREVWLILIVICWEGFIGEGRDIGVWVDFKGLGLGFKYLGRFFFIF